MVPKVGLEPTLCCQNGILNPACLPIPPLRLKGVLGLDQSVERCILPELFALSRVFCKFSFLSG